VAELLPIPERLRASALDRDPKRMPWAEPGGPARSLAWARAALEPSGQGSFSATQQRTWNLSTIWRLVPASTPDAAIWLKQVPHFMRHESRVLRWLNRAVPGAAPTLVATDEPGCSLLADVSGDDLYGAPVALRQLILEQLHVIQGAGAEAVEDLLALVYLIGEAPSVSLTFAKSCWRGHRSIRGSTRFCGVSTNNSSDSMSVGYRRLSCMPTTIPANARGSLQGVTLLDWGEAYVGNPVTDLLGLLGGLPPAEAALLTAHWCAGWRRVAPRCKPERALELAPFIAAVEGATIFAHFLHEIERTEWPYHVQDVPRCLQTAAELLATPP